MGMITSVYANCGNSVMLDRVALARKVYPMRYKSVVAVTFGTLLNAITLFAQLQHPASWRGAGSMPCVGFDGGVYKCPPAARVSAVRAGRLFDSKTVQMLTKQVVLLS